MVPQLTPEMSRLYRLADAVYTRYVKAYGPELLVGVEALIAEELARLTGGQVCAGTLAVGGQPRQHFWVVKNGIILDPIYFAARKTEPGFVGRGQTGGIEVLEKVVDRYRMYAL